MPWKVVADFRTTLLPPSSYPQVYAAGTTQNHPNVAGLFRFLLAGAFDTRAHPDGTYRLDVEAADVKTFAVKMCPAVAPTSEDHIDRFLKRLAILPREVEIDMDVEAIVDRIGGVNRRIKRGMEATLAEHGLSHPDWQVLTSLRLAADHRSSPRVSSRPTSSCRAAR